MAKLRGAKKISELDEALDFNNIAVDDGTPIGKRITKDRLKNLIGSEGAQLKAVQGGTVGSPTALVAPETTEYRWMRASPGEYAFNGTPYSATVGKEWIFEWLSGTWSLKDMGALPSQPKEEQVKQWVLSESYTIQSYIEGLNGLTSAVITYPDGVGGSISSVTYDTQNRVSSMVFEYNSSPEITKTLMITYLNNQVQTSIN